MRSDSDNLFPLQTVPQCSQRINKKRMVKHSLYFFWERGHVTGVERLEQL